MRRKSLREAYCPIAKALDVIGDWWSLLIVRDAFRGIRRFSDFQKNLDISKNILTRRLHTLVENDILEHTPSEDSAYREYVLTPKGRRLFHVMVALRQFGEENLYDKEYRHGRSHRRKTGSQAGIARRRWAIAATR